MSKMRVWHVPQVGCDVVFYIPVETVEEGKKVLDILSAYDLFQMENRIKPDFSNSNGIQMYNEEEKDWEDWCLETEDEYYDDIDDYLVENKDIQEFSKSVFGQLKRKNNW